MLVYDFFSSEINETENCDWFADSNARVDIKIQKLNKLRQ
jgi:hypothetical protein